MNIISSAQCRAARAFLKWSFNDLAMASGISRQSLHSFEKGRMNIKARNISAIIQAFGNAGIKFYDNGGFRYAGEKAKIYSWQDNILRCFLDDLRKIEFKPGDEILICSQNGKELDELFHDPKLEEEYLRYLKTNNIKERIILSQESFERHSGIAEFCCLDRRFPTFQPMIVYQNKFGSLVLKPQPELIMAECPEAADNYRKTFDFLWSRARFLNSLHC